MSPEDHAQDFAAELAGNWKKFESFAWSTKRELEDPERFAIVYTRNRDSGLYAESNHAVLEGLIEKALESGELDEKNIWSESHNHWACGWVDGWVVRVYGPDGSVTKEFQWFSDNYLLPLSEYSLLSDEDYWEREYNAAIEAITQNGRNHLVDNAPEDWACKVWGWFADNNQGALESSDDQGPWPSTDEIDQALESLGLLEDEDAQ